MHLIGINGFKRSGKNTVFEIVRDHDIVTGFAGEPLSVKGVGFADNLKVMAARALGYRGDNAEMIRLMDELKEFGVLVEERDFPEGSQQADAGGNTTVASFRTITGRQYLQNFGNEAREIFGDTFWIDQVLPDMSVVARYSGTDVLCVTDVRYANEAERIRDLGGVVWEVVRPELESDGHISERRLPANLVDWTIYNGGSLDDLVIQVRSAAFETVR